MSRAARNSKSSKTKNIVLPLPAAVHNLTPAFNEPAPSPEPSAVSPPATAKPSISTSFASGSAKDVAVLALGDAGEILAARDACRAIFGWEPAELVGRNVRVLLKDGLDNDVGRFLHRHRAGKNPTGTTEMRVYALRRGRHEFLALVTTLTWNCDMTGVKMGDSSRLCWTAAFRDLDRDSQSSHLPVQIPRPELESPATAGTDASQSAAETTSTPAAAAALATSTVPAQTPAAAPAAAPASASDQASPSAPVASPLSAPSPEPTPPTASSAPASAAETSSASPAVTPSEPVKVAEKSKPPIVAPPVPAPALAQPVEGAANEQTRKLMAELAAARLENEKLGCRESELRTELETVKESAGRTEAALHEETSKREKLEERLQNLSNALREEQAERSQRFGEELVGLRKERDELNARLAAEQEAANESSKRAQDLESSLTRNAEEFAHAKSELERQTAEREKSETSWREQLDTAWIAKKEIEGAFAGAVEQNRRFEEELAKLRHEHDELTQKLAAEQKVASDSRERAREVESRLSRNAADSDRARSELEKENVERQRADTEWREQLEAAQSNQARLESSLAQATKRAQQLEKAQVDLARERDELQTRIACQQQAAEAASRRADELEARITAEQQAAEAARRRADELQTRISTEQEAAEAAGRRAEDLQRDIDEKAAELQRLSEEFEKQNSERCEVESRIQDEEKSAQSRIRKLEEDWAGALERNMEFEQELNKLRQDNDELDRKFLSGQQALGAAEAARADLENQCAEYKREAEACRDQLQTAEAWRSRMENSLVEATHRAERLAAESAHFAELREELENQIRAEQEVAREWSARADEFQRRLDQSAAEIEQLTAALDQHSAERQQLEARADDQQAAAQAQAKKLEADWASAMERNVRFEEQLVKLRAERDDLSTQLKTEHRTLSEAIQQTAELQRRLEGATTELQRVTGETKRSRGERDRAEAEWREQLETAKALARKLDAAWTTATERNRRVEAEISTARQERVELQAKLSAAERELAQLKARNEQLENQAKLAAREAGRPRPTTTGPLESPRATAAVSDPSRKPPTPMVSEPRREAMKLNGHRTPTPGITMKPTPTSAPAAPPAPLPSPAPRSPLASPTSTAPSASRPSLSNAVPGNGKGHDTDMIKVEPRHQSTVQQYNFGDAATATPRRDAAPSKKRLQP